MPKVVQKENFKISVVNFIKNLTALKRSIFAPTQTTPFAYQQLSKNKKSIPISGCFSNMNIF